MTWTRPITADGHTATPEQMRAAWAAWVARDRSRRSLNALAADLVRVGTGSDWRIWICARVAVRMLQTARKAGVIRFERGVWVIVEDRA